MTLSEYFANARGIGVLATADRDGKANVAVYSRPHFVAGQDDACAFIMGDRRTHENLQANPHAAYLFIEDAEGYVGKRLTLVKTGEEADQEKIQAVRRKLIPSMSEEGLKHLVHFRIESVRPLIGNE